MPHKQQKRYSQAKTEPSVPDYQTLADRIVWTLTPGTLARTRDGLGEMQYKAPGREVKNNNFLMVKCQLLP